MSKIERGYVPEGSNQTLKQKFTLQMQMLGLYRSKFISALWKGYPDKMITEFGKAVEKSERFPKVQGIDAFDFKLRAILDREDRPNVLVVGNHPDFLASRSHPLWFMAVPTSMGKTTGEDPYLFASGTLFPKVVGKLKSTHLFVTSKYNRTIFERSREELLNREKQSGFFIFPEGKNTDKDQMEKAHSEGTLNLIETAIKNNVPLVVLPIAFLQNIATRDKVTLSDRYSLLTGDPISLNDLIPRNYIGNKQNRQIIIDRLMSHIAGMLPEQKRGYYKSSSM